MDLELSQQVVQVLTGALKGLRLYPPQHPAIQRQFETLLANLYTAFQGKEVLRLGVLQGSLFFEDYLFQDNHAAAAELATLFQNLELEGLEFGSRISAADLTGLLMTLSEGRDKGQDFARQLQERNVRNVRPVALQTTDEPEEEHTPREVYGRALKVVDSIFEDVRLGKIPSSEDARKVVKSMAQMTLTEPHALFALSMLKDYDQYTFTHSVNVSVIALAVGRACGLDETELQALGLGALLHDLGKLKVNRDIINKPGRLTEEEFEQIRLHPRNGADIVGQMEGVPAESIDIVLGHHLLFNRNGYPQDARGRKFSSLADMTAIADTYDAMTTLRSYQQPVTPRKAIKYLQEVAGTLLHPEYVEKFAKSLGPYPVGSLVRLDSNEIGLVVWVGTQRTDDVQLKLLFDAEGEPLAEPEKIELTGEDSRRIVAEVDPFVKGIDVTDYFE